MATYQPAKTGYYADLRELVRNNPDADLPTLQKLAAMGQYARQQEVSSDMYENPGQMLEDLQARKQREAREAEVRQVHRPPRPAAPQQPQATFFDRKHRRLGGSMFDPYQQMAMHRGMVADVNSAIRDEMDSRVAQERERRRLEHEKEMERMRQEALLKRLQMEREMAERQMRMSQEAQDRSNGILFSTRWLKD